MLLQASSTFLYDSNLKLSTSKRIYKRGAKIFNIGGKFCEKLHFGSPKIDKITKTSCLPISNHPILTLFKYGLNTYIYILNLKYHEILII